MNGDVNRLLTVKSFIPAPAVMLKKPFAGGAEKEDACDAGDYWKTLLS
ncbi:MAG: hypothetical protein ABIL58_01240 [Pseudomonadota bacterium]